MIDPCCGGFMLEVYESDEPKARAAMAAELEQHGLSDLLPSVTIETHARPDSPSGIWYTLRMAIPAARVPTVRYF